MRLKGTKFTNQTAGELESCMIEIDKSAYVAQNSLAFKYYGLNFSVEIKIL